MCACSLPFSYRQGSERSVVPSAFSASERGRRAEPAPAPLGTEEQGVLASCAVCRRKTFSHRELSDRNPSTSLLPAPLRECCLLERSSRAALPGPSALRPLRRDSTGARAVEGGGTCVAPPALPQVFATSSIRPTWPPYRRPVSSRLCSRIRPESAGLIIHSFLPPPLARQPSKGRCVDCLLHGRTGRTLGSDRWKTLGRPRGQGGAARTWLSQLPGGVPGAALGHSTIRPQEGAPAHTCPQVWAPPHSQKFSRAREAASCSCRSVVPKLSPVNKVSAEIESKRLETFVAIVRVILCLLNLMKIWSCISYLFSFHFPRQPFLL